MVKYPSGKKVLIVILSVLFCFTIGAAEKKLRFVQDEEFSKLEGAKAVNELARKALKKIGYEMTMESFPLKRAFSIVESGEADGECPGTLAALDDSKNLIAVKEPVIVVKIMVYTISGKLNKVSWNDLKDLSVGALLGDEVVQDNLGGKMKKGKLESPKTPESLFLMLLAGRVDYVVTYENAALPVIETDPT